ncbi:MAG: FAD:protein FMN transferase [Gemmatimonadota bacterium]
METGSAISGPDSLYHFTRPVMGTDAEIYLYAESGEAASELFQAAFAEIEAAEDALSIYSPTSEISRINQNAGVEPVTTDPEVFHLIGLALDCSERTGGAFDITVGPLVEAWGFFRGGGRSPSPEELSAARANSGWKKVALDEGRRSVRFRVPGVELDLGGLGKGWALDRAARKLKGLGVEAALLGLGQSTYLAIGAPPDTEGWVVSIPDPRSSTEAISTIRLRDRALSTSGNAERYFVLDGRRLSHIIDPRTGRPAEGVEQVTVAALNATESDALSTALFVMGPQAARQLHEGDPGFQALMILDQGADQRTVRLGWPGPISNRTKEREVG